MADVSKENVVVDELDWGMTAAEAKMVKDAEAAEKQSALEDTEPTEAENAEPNETPAATEKTEGTNKNDQENIPKEKSAQKTTNDLLKELLEPAEQPKETKIKAPETPEEITEVESLKKEKEELDRKLKTQEEVSLIKDLLSQITPAERDIIGPELVALIKSGERQRFNDLPVKERVAKLIKLAQASKMDDLFKLRSLAPKDTNEEIQEITSVQTGKPAKESKAQRVEALKQAALDGDKDAQRELWGLDENDW